MKLQKFFTQLKKLKFPLLVRRVVGHSMLPVLPPGTLVFGLRRYRQLKLGQVVIIEHDGKEKIKRISQLKNNLVYLLGDHENGSTDSRNFGWLSAESVVAIVLFPRAHKIADD